jgi:hypothetical protein
MKYAYDIQSDGSKTVYIFADESSRGQWIAAFPSTREPLSGNSREVKSALYSGVAITLSDRQITAQSLIEITGAEKKP